MEVERKLEGCEKLHVSVGHMVIVEFMLERKVERKRNTFENVYVAVGIGDCRTNGSMMLCIVLVEVVRCK